ncbi:MAG TPA: M20/M25/M40 family metallo-hydrolase [Draconibacterium sp.]|nr:M20/M25/M40 family metallo-hydrolase [Draconibacterium sp.]
MKNLFVFLVLFLSGIACFAQTEIEKGLDAITQETVKGQLEFLASDWTEGRAVGTKGEYISGDYIASMLQVYGIKPFGDEEINRLSRREMMAGIKPKTGKSYFQNFSLIQYEPGDEQTFSVISNGLNSEKSVDFAYKTDFSVRTGAVAQSAKAPVVFVGYGFVNDEKGYNDLKKINLAGKIAVVLAGFPGHKDTASIAYKKFAPEGRYARYYLERNKTEQLEKAGAIAIIQINTDFDPMLSWAQNQIYPVKGSHYEADKPLGSYYNTSMAMPADSLTSNIPTFTVTTRLANELISGTGVSFADFEKAASEKMVPASKELTGKIISFKTTVKSEIVKARNVLGYIEGEKKDEFIVVGGHYDHLGKYDGYIWNGADDNGSGTVGVMTIAKAFMATGKKPEKSIIFAAWTGEEKGLFGSKYFVQQAQKNNLNVVLNLNYDMIARDEEKDSLKNMADMVYTKANAGIADITKKNLEEYKINLDLSYSPSEKPSGGSDHAPFAEVGIPVFYFMAAMHPDYHQPSDELSKINWEKMTNIIRLGFLNTWEFANSNEYLKVNPAIDFPGSPKR